jgi:hypothetical protein
MPNKNNTLAGTRKVSLKVDLKLQNGPACPEPAAPDKLGFGLHGELTADQAWRQACRWRLARILRFIDCQKKQRAWISFSELAERDGRNIGIAEGYEQLKHAVINEFERNGRSRVLYLHPAVIRAKMTREWMRNVVEICPPETVRRHYLAPCWIPRELADARCQSWRRPDDQVPKETRGRHECADADALDEMHRLVTKEGLRRRAAAKQVVAQGLAHGSGLAESTIDRVRRKFALKFPELRKPGTKLSRF